MEPPVGSPVQTKKPPRRSILQALFGSGQKKDDDDKARADSKDSLNSLEGPPRYSNRLAAYALPEEPPSPTLEKSSKRGSGLFNRLSGGRRSGHKSASKDDGASSSSKESSPRLVPLPTIALPVVGKPRGVVFSVRMTRSTADAFPDLFTGKRRADSDPTPEYGSTLEVCPCCCGRRYI